MGGGGGISSGSVPGSGGNGAPGSGGGGAGARDRQNPLNWDGGAGTNGYVKISW